MADRLRCESSVAWLAMALGLCAAALLGWHVERSALDWQPVLALSQPWRAWSAVAVHYSGLHLFANLGGALLVGALGRVARLPTRSLVAWLVAWPLTQFGLLLQPELRHYGGLSGVLHAGVAVAAVHLVLRPSNRRQRHVGAAVLCGLLAKVLSESPWSGPLRHPPGWDIAVAPLAHASGVFWGVLCSVLSELRRSCRSPAATLHD